ncbi:MAG: type II toxin-antitoxin system RatA family toxin [Chromatiales bacterium]|nr:type II toxin-antitoxin system RatA family toxin [Chromatiales bacterium]
MRTVTRSAIVPYTPAQMFELVADVEAYPRFLPGCVGSSIRSRTPDELVATLQLARGPLRTAFTTRNGLEPPRRMTLELLEGPFLLLEGAWEFTALGEQGSRAVLSLRFEFDSAMKDLLLGPVFEATCNQLVDAFVERAAVVYA